MSGEQRRCRKCNRPTDNANDDVCAICLLDEKLWGPQGSAERQRINREAMAEPVSRAAHAAPGGATVIPIHHRHEDHAHVPVDIDPELAKLLRRKRFVDRLQVVLIGALVLVSAYDHQRRMGRIPWERR